MAVSFSCRCENKDRKNWKVLQRNYNLSHFEHPKGEPHYSDYSTVVCVKCLACGRTKAKYVDELEDINIDEWQEAIQNGR